MPKQTNKSALADHDLSHHDVLDELRIALVRSYGQLGDRIRVPGGSTIYRDPDYLCSQGKQILISVADVCTAEEVKIVTSFVALPVGDQDLSQAAKELSSMPLDQGLFVGNNNGEILITVNFHQEEWQEKIRKCGVMSPMGLWLYSEPVIRVLMSFFEKHFELQS